MSYFKTTGFDPGLSNSGKTMLFFFFFKKLPALFRTVILLLMIMAVSATYHGLLAQGFSGGFKAGLNYGNIILGNAETDAAGNVLETTSGNTGFFIGAIFTYGITDRFGLTADLLYNQKGGRYIFEGEGYILLNQAGTDNRYLFFGQKRENLNITHSFIDLPVQAYVDLTHDRRIRLTAGIGPGFMVTSGAEGELTFSSPNITVDGQNEMSIRLSYNYFRDAAMEEKSGFFREMQAVGFGRIQNVVPGTAGAYYMFEEKPGNTFYGIDLMITGGIAYRLSGNLWVGARAVYSLRDVSRDSADVSRAVFTANEPTDAGFVPRVSDDRYFQGQVWLGFSF